MTSIARWVEVHRLAMEGREAAIAREVGSRVGWMWLATSRFADVARLAGLTLTLGKDADACYQLGWAKDATGNPAAALEYYGQALRMYAAVAGRGGEAATLSNIGTVYDGLGERQRALEYYGQALPIRQEVGDRAGEAVTRYNMAMNHRALGELDRAVAELEQVVELDRQVSHPDLESDTEMLHRVRQELASSSGDS